MKEEEEERLFQESKGRAASAGSFVLRETSVRILCLPLPVPVLWQVACLPALGGMIALILRGGRSRFRAPWSLCSVVGPI